MDLFLFQQINHLAGNWVCLDAVGIFFAKYLGYILATSVFLIFLLPAGRQGQKWKIILQAFSAVALARFGVVELIRWIWARPRPFVENHANLLLDKIDQLAFPSGHAAFFFALSFVVYCYNKKAGIFFFVASFLISLSRVFVGVHWPSDILVGAIVGIFCGWLVVKIFKKYTG